MAEKEITNVIKLQIEAGKATPAPPVGPALGSSGVNIMQFVKEFNDRTANQPGMIIPVVITVYKDKSFEFITKVPPVAVLIKKALKDDLPIDMIEIDIKNIWTILGEIVAFVGFKLVYGINKRGKIK